MRMNSLLRLLFALFLLYVASPSFPFAQLLIEKIFWMSWLLFFLFVFGSNLATLLKMSELPSIEQTDEFSTIVETSKEKRGIARMRK